MKCSKCGSEWSVPSRLAIEIIKCPFCNADILQKPQTISEALARIVEKEGIETFKNPLRISGLLADMFPSMGRERNALKIAFEKGIASKIIAYYFEKDLGLKRIQINQMNKVLVEDAWLSESAAQFVLSTLLEAIGEDENKTGNSNNEVTINSEEINEKLYDRQAETQVNNVTIDIAKNLELNEKYDEALEMYKILSSKGNVEAFYCAGAIYESIIGDIKESVKWYKSAAEAGYSKAQNNLGCMYENGEGVECDYSKAIYWFEKAAQNGNRNAQHNLAYFYYQGKGTRKDYIKAVEWYTKAANQGHPGSQNNLGIMYEYGLGVEKDLKEAARWYLLSSKNGNKDGDDNYSRISKRIDV